MITPELRGSSISLRTGFEHPATQSLVDAVNNHDRMSARLIDGIDMTVLLALKGFNLTLSFGMNGFEDFRRNVFESLWVPTELTSHDGTTYIVERNER